MGLLNTLAVKRLWDHISKGIKNPSLLKDKKWQVELFKKLVKVEEFRIMFGVKKSYLVGVLLFALGGLKALGIIDEGTYQVILSILTGAGIMTLRAATSKVEDKMR